MLIKKTHTDVLIKHVHKIKDAIAKWNKGDEFSLKKLLEDYWDTIPIGDRIKLGHQFRANVDIFKVDYVGRNSSNTSIYRKL